MRKLTDASCASPLSAEKVHAPRDTDFREGFSTQ